jgi:hypothetical protein
MKCYCLGLCLRYDQQQVRKCKLIQFVFLLNVYRMNNTKVQLPMLRDKNEIATFPTFYDYVGLSGIRSIT